MSGHEIVPVDQFVLKVHSRCDLACDHCYVYESADQSWRGRPAAITPGIVAQAAERIAEHVQTHELSRVEVVLHGGEPLLCGVAGLRAVITTLEKELSGPCQLDLKVHTNGVLLNERFCELFAEHDVMVGVSLDGGRKANDRHRNYRDGRSSYDAVIRAIRLLDSDRFRRQYAGLLCTIDVANDPVTVYESLAELNPRRIDLLLPHATWDAPPARREEWSPDYADWLIAVFDRWQADGYPFRIRTFDSIIGTLVGRESQTEALGLAPVSMVVIETDGSYEQADSLKVAFDGAPATGLSVFTHSLDEVAGHPGMTARQDGIDNLSATCRECPVVRSCGGGMYAHRYKSGRGFDNPSVYCADLAKLIGHVNERLPDAIEAMAKPGLSISDSALATLAAGAGDADAIGQLTQVQRSLRQGLLTAVYEQAMTAPVVPALTKGRLREAWRLLVLADSGSREALEEVLSHPYLRVWVARCLEGLACADGCVKAGLTADLEYLGAVAAAVAIRGQARGQVTVPVTDGAMHLPGLGRLMVALPGGRDLPDETGASARVAVEADWIQVVVGPGAWLLSRPGLLNREDDLARPCSPEGAVVVGGTGRDAVWEPARTLTAPGIRVVLEDGDPYRDCRQWPPASRLTGAEFSRWQREFELAWQEIRERHAAYAPAIAAGLAVLTPMTTPPAGLDASSPACPAFGAVGVALPGDPVALALLLIREFQHVKLGAIVDQYDLCDPADERLYPVPWDPRPRPLYGLLQGAYVYLAVAEFWRERAGLGQHDQAKAVRQYEHWRVHTAAAVETLADSGSLTQRGLVFAHHMGAAMRKTDVN